MRTSRQKKGRHGGSKDCQQITQAPRLSLINCDQFSVTIGWKSPDPDLSYQLQYVCMARNQTWEQCNSVRVMSGEKIYRLKVDGLDSSSTYNFRLQPYSNDGTTTCGGPGPESSFDTQGACCILDLKGMICSIKLWPSSDNMNREMYHHLSTNNSMENSGDDEEDALP
mmetsp:Transcript_42740/g.74239  ORF Transcript_42740/g.74239 Transcript_42740/m.74239 type:complete len:168 (+) Transcript_42740:60-563(+)